jgi:hypothetical protein
MPITKEKQALYGPDWKAVSRRIRERDLNRCACTGECGRRHEGICGARNHEPHPVTGSTVVLTVAHRDVKPGEPGHDDDSNLTSMCQACHLSYDKDEHRANGFATRERRKEEAGQGRLF